MKDIISGTIDEGNLETTTKLLKESINDFSKLFYSSPAAISIMDSNTEVYVKVNEKFLEIFGYTKEEVIDRTVAEVGIINKEEFHNMLNILKEKGCTNDVTCKCKSKDGNIIYTIASSEIIEINKKKYFVSSFLNITKIRGQQIIIEKQHKEIMDSINYARFIQEAVFPTRNEMKEILPESFVLAKPKDIVSGDFYWIKRHENKIFVSVCDCTGHGVPGAFISIIGYKLLTKFINEYKLSKPAAILNQLNNEFSTSGSKVIENIVSIKDGMDIAICVIDKTNMTMQYAGAYSPVYQIRKGKLTKLSVDKIPIHLFTKNSGDKFTNHEIKIENGDVFYLFSDGYSDQFGGLKGKKFLSKNLQALIQSMQHLAMADQREIFEKTIEEWKNTNGEKQTDDILILGFKV